MIGHGAKTVVVLPRLNSLALIANKKTRPLKGGFFVECCKNKIFVVASPERGEAISRAMDHHALYEGS